MQSEPDDGAAESVGDAPSEGSDSSGNDASGDERRGAGEVTKPAERTRATPRKKATPRTSPSPRSASSARKVTAPRPASARPTPTGIAGAASTTEDATADATTRDTIPRDDAASASTGPSMRTTAPRPRRTSTPRKPAPSAPRSPRKSTDRVDPAPPTAEPAAAERAVAEPAVAEPPALAEPALTEAPRAEPVRAEPVRAEPVRAEPVRAEPVVEQAAVVLQLTGLTKRFDGTTAVDAIDLAVRTGSIFGIVGPNGAGKTTTLSMVTGLLRPDSGHVIMHGADVWTDPVSAKRSMGVLPDRLRLFDRLTGAQLLYYSGTLRGLDRATVKSRTADLAAAFGLDEALGRLVTDYSAGMTKKIAIAAAMIHSPRILILDEPFEAVDPVSTANVIEILRKYAAAGGTVVLSSHSMDLIQRVCDTVAIIVHGRVLASGPIDEVRAGASLEERFIELAGGRKAAEGMEWLHSFSA